jgi:hypothetical protein
VVEVQVAVDHADDRRRIDSDGAQGFVEPHALGLVQLVDELVAEPDAGVEHDRAVGVGDDVSVDRRRGLAWGLGMPVGKPDHREVQPFDAGQRAQHDAEC